MRNRRRRPDLVSPSAVDFSRSRSDRSTAHPIAPVKHPLALNHQVTIRESMWIEPARRHGRRVRASAADSYSVDCAILPISVEEPWGPGPTRHDAEARHEARCRGVAAPRSLRPRAGEPR